MNKNILKKNDDLRECFVDENKEKNYTLEQLVTKLKECFDIYPEKALAIHMFGIKYGQFIRKNNYSVNEIVKNAGINNSYIPEMNKGIKLSYYVDAKEMIETTQDDYVKFKLLLKWFLNQLRINNKLIDGIRTSGKGVDGNRIRNYYSKWREFSKFTLDCALQSGYQSKNSKVNYIHYFRYNIRPHFTTDNNVDYFYLDVYLDETNNNLKNKIDIQIKNITEMNQYYVDSLDLFSNNEPNEHLKKLFDDYNKLLEINFFEDEQSLDYNYTDILERNLYVIHIKKENTSLSNEKPHICIGWSELGDLLNVKKREEIKQLLKTIYTNESNFTIGQWVAPIFDFVNECQIGDYVIFSNNNLMNIGRITSNYYFRNEMPNDEYFDYKNTRDVEWIMKDIDRSLISNDLNDSLSKRPTFYKINDYKSAILDILNNCYDSSNDDEKLTIFDYQCSNKEGVNLIVYGTPGCGKSYYVEHTLLKDYRHNEEGLCIDAIRTTFYQDYTNTDFVGQIMPVVNGDKVTYEFNPGPFTLALNKAIQNPDLPVALVIEELNRGNAASIFGDIFQLLDRENGTSVYNITNVNIQKYLQEQNPDYSFEYVKLPSNLSIFATMNTSDQNVFTLDNAFKRRWKFEKLKNTFEKHSYATKLVPGMDLDWKEFCTAINNFIIESKDEITNSEDKQLGVYFIDEKGLRTENVTSDEVQRKEFAYKIFEYLWDDVVKYDRTTLFKDAKTLDDLIDNYVKSGSNDIDGKNVFVENIFKKNGN